MNDQPSPVAHRRFAPKGGRVVWLATRDGARLRLMLWHPSDARESVAILPGRTEFIEGYFETIHELLSRDYAVAVLDMRNHGLSARPLANAQKHHLDDFSILTDDVAHTLERMRGEGLPRPITLLAHSMGGHAAIRFLRERPNVDVQRAVLTAPMIAIHFGPLPQALACRLARAACAMGLARAYGLGQRDWQGGQARERLRRRLTSDVQRFADQDWHLEQLPALKLGGVTWGWLAAALDSCRTLERPGYAEAIETPSLFVLAGDESVIDNDAARRFARRMPKAEIVEIAEAKHEILREADAYRRQFWAAFDRFMGGRNTAGSDSAI